MTIDHIMDDVPPKVDKLEAAKQYLGERWVLSPQYNSKNNPAHKCRDSYQLRNVRKHAVIHERI